MALRFDTSSLSDASLPEVTFYDSSFFQHDPTRQLPSPHEVMQQVPGFPFGAVKFENLGLVVKFGFEVRFEEAQTMRALRSAFPHNEIPVPEVFGWKYHENMRFIYMSFIDGITLDEAWPSFTENDKESICVELRNVISSLRQITRDPTDDLICSVNNGRLQDRFFRFDDEGGPFSSVQTFNSFFSAVAIRLPPQLEGSMKIPYRDLLSDHGNVYFTHGDLTLTNVMVYGEPGSYRIKAIIDWEQAGWYPEYWEYCKLLVGVHYEHEWREAGWVDRLMESFENEWVAFAEYTLWRNP